MPTSAEENTTERAAGQNLARALDALRARGNPFRQQFARNSDDPICARYHVEDLFQDERAIVREFIDAFRWQPSRPTAVLPILAPRGAGKTHLLHSLKHGPAAGPQLVVTPGTFRQDRTQSDQSFLEYVLYQLIHVLLSDAPQRGTRPLLELAELATRRLLIGYLDDRLDAHHSPLTAASARSAPGERPKQGEQSPWSRWFQGWTSTQGDSKPQLERWREELARQAVSSAQVVAALQLDSESLLGDLSRLLELGLPANVDGYHTRSVLLALARLALFDDGLPLADFLTDGFVESPFELQPARSQLVLSLLQTLVREMLASGVSVVVAFDQLEELLYGQSLEEFRRSSDAFFGGIVELMSKVSGLAVLLLAEEGLWNRMVPKLPPHIQDRLHEPNELPARGLVRQIRLRPLQLNDLVAVVDQRVRHTLERGDPGEFPLVAPFPGFPFERAFLDRLCQQESVLRLMLQACCQQLDDLLAGRAESVGAPAANSDSEPSATSQPTPNHPSGEGAGRAIVDAHDFRDRWEQAVRAARRKLEPVGSLASAAAELTACLVQWLRICQSLGVVQDDWRLVAVDEPSDFGPHPTYGKIAALTWEYPDGVRQRIGVGFWLGRGVGKPRDLEAKLALLADDPPTVDHLVLFRPEEDARLTGRCKELWDRATARGRSIRMEPMALIEFARLYAFPGWMSEMQTAAGDLPLPEDLFVFLAEETQDTMQRIGLPQGPDPLTQAA